MKLMKIRFEDRDDIESEYISCEPEPIYAELKGCESLGKYSSFYARSLSA